VDCLTLPALGKDGAGQYYPRSLAVPLKDLIELRTNMIRSAIESFEPDVLIADKVPWGVFGELRPSLEWLCARAGARCILGLREVLDEPEVVRREWHLAANEAAIRAYYDTVWIYGDPQVYNPVREYGFSGDIAAKVRYTGYLDRRGMSDLASGGQADLLAALAMPPGRLVLCLVGGGQDGYYLADTFLQANLPPETNGLVITGPFMPPEARRSLRCRSAANPRQRVIKFVDRPESFLNLADSVIAMGGYNTVCEVLSFEKRALIVPRVTPRREQLIRAERLRNLGLLDMLHPTNLTPRVLTEWLAHDPGSPRRIRDRIDLSGLTRLPGLLNEVLTTPSGRSGCEHNPSNSVSLPPGSGQPTEVFAPPSQPKEVYRVNH
jgi:predicted glycosyltransferase